MDKIVLAIAVLLLAAPAQASTAIVDETHSVNFVFGGWWPEDAGAIDGMGYGQTAPLQDDNLRLASQANFALHFGSTLGGSDLGTAYVYNPFDSIDNIGSYLRVEPFYPPGVFYLPTTVAEILTTFYVNVEYIDDAFGLGFFFLNAGANHVYLAGALCNPDCPAPTRPDRYIPPPVPIPAALPLFAAAIGGLFGWRRWRTR